MNPVYAQAEPRRRLLSLPYLGEWRPSRFIGIILFFGAHVPLAFLLARSSTISTGHALITLVAGLWVAGTSTRTDRIAYLIAYMTGAETLWRMTQASIVWEYGKYAVIAVLLVSILRTGRLKGPIPPIVFFLLLLPSIVLPMSSVSTSVLRNEISFNLSGPLSLAISVWFFYGLEFTVPQMQRIYLALLGPLISVSTIALVNTISAGTIFFSNNSNFVTSGGFGPNQVSSALGLGALAAFLLFLDNKSGRPLKIMMFGLMALMAIQSALTFSRGGLYAAAGAAIVAVFYLIRQTNARFKVITAILALVLMTNFVILPQLDSFTGGALSKRFTNTKLTGRDKLILSDLEAWSDNPLFGTGPGQAKKYRSAFRNETAAHTEYSRLLAEHGIFGLAALLTLLFMALQYLRRARPGPDKAFSAAMIIWSLFYMTTAAMRMVAPSFVFGLSAATLAPENNQESNG